MYLEFSVLLCKEHAHHKLQKDYPSLIEQDSEFSDDSFAICSLYDCQAMPYMWVRYQVKPETAARIFKAGKYYMRDRTW